jgi:hypothetical protein
MKSKRKQGSKHRAIYGEKVQTVIQGKSIPNMSEEQ